MYVYRLYFFVHNNMELEEQVVSKPQSRQSFLVRGGAFSDNLLPMAIYLMIPCHKALYVG